VSAAGGEASITIDGTVRDSDGEPIDGARVMIARAPRAFPDIAALTSADGTFSLGLTGEGEHELLVVADGYEEARLTVEPKQVAETIEVVLSRRP
jgi:Carboxypeptidase regulatory-like domain